jgi:hypothetical protein
MAANARAVARQNFLSFAHFILFHLLESKFKPFVLTKTKHSFYIINIIENGEHIMLNHNISIKSLKSKTKYLSLNIERKHWKIIQSLF